MGLISKVQYTVYLEGLEGYGWEPRKIKWPTVPPISRESAQKHFHTASPNGAAV